MYKNGIVEWRFENILLPDSNVNEPASHGFVRYRIKPKNTLAIGDQVLNSASIYFDYNEPVKTNTTVNTVAVIVTGINDPALIKAKIFPNPAHSVLYMQVKGQFYYRLYDVSGKQVMAGENNFNQAAINILPLSKGVYFLEIKTKKGRAVTKILVQ